jgi:hypothetical protein
MDLLSVDEIQKRLLEQYEASDREIAELNMKDSSLSEDQLDEFAAALSIRFPESFKEAVLLYDFGELNIGGVFFGQKGSYIEFLRSVNAPGTDPAWWGAGVRPRDYLMIGGTDGYVILLNTTDGSIVAYLRTEDWSANGRIAANFKQLVRGAGTVYFGRRTATDKKALGEEIAGECGADVHAKFWEELAQGIT